MTTNDLAETARALVAPGKGILAADESTGTIAKRLAGIGVDSTADTRRAYRELLFSTAGAAEFISGVILYDETLRQSASTGELFVDMLLARGTLPGIKVDTGAKDLAAAPGETVTEGLDGLRERCAEYAGLGARFAKWRAVIRIGPGLPSRTCIAVNAHALARYAALAQEAGLVPIVEPEVLMDGDHAIARCQAVTEEVLVATFAELHRQRIQLEGTLLKPNMVIAGTDCADQAGVDEVAARTVASLKRCVPSAVPGIVFLSGGQSEELATAHLNAMNAAGDLPWQVSFSYGRALQQSALKTWAGKPENVAPAQAAFLHRARMNGAARHGRYTPALEAELKQAS